MWSEIEAVALDREKPEEIVDLTIPNNQRIDSRAGPFLEEIARNLGLSNMDSKPKRKAETSTTNAKKLKTGDENSGLNVESEAKAGKVNFCKIQFKI